MLLEVSSMVCTCGKNIYVERDNLINESQVFSRYLSIKSEK